MTIKMHAEKAIAQWQMERAASEFISKMPNQKLTDEAWGSMAYMAAVAGIKAPAGAQLVDFHEEGFELLIDADDAGQNLALDQICDYTKEEKIRFVYGPRSGTPAHSRGENSFSIDSEGLVAIRMTCTFKEWHAPIFNKIMNKTAPRNN